MTRKHVFPAGKYYIGDPCYLISKDEDWKKVGEDTGWFGFDSVAPGYDDGIFQWNGRTCFASGTAYGDGLYYVTPHEEYGDYEIGVDAGLIGIIPYKNDKLDNFAPVLSMIVDFEKDFEVWEKDGIFHFGKIKINTR